MADNEYRNASSSDRSYKNAGGGVVVAGEQEDKLKSEVRKINVTEMTQKYHFFCTASV